MLAGMEQIELSPIKQIELLASKIPGVVSLAQGIPADDTPLVIKEKVITAIEEGRVARYSLTYGLPQLREAIERHLRQQRMEYDWEREIIVTCGSIEGITASLITILKEKRGEVVIPSPAYASYQQAIRVAGGLPVEIDLSDDWQFDIDLFSQKVSDKTRAVIIANPNNPTGTIFSRQQLLAIGKLAKKYNFFVILDEVYRDLVFDDIDFFSLAELPEFRDVVIRVYSFSKAYAMTGWRVAYLHADERIVSEIIKVHDALVTCAPVVSQYAALAALEIGEDEKEIIRKAYQQRRDLICQRLNKLSEFFSYQRPTASYFVFPKILWKKNPDSWQTALQLLHKAKVATVPGVSFGQKGEGHLRMCFGRSPQDINLAFDRLEKFLSKIK